MYLHYVGLLAVNLSPLVLSCLSRVHGKCLSLLCAPSLRFSIKFFVEFGQHMLTFAK
jgi:hypothetical protein